MQGKPPGLCNLNHIASQALTDLEYRIKESGAKIDLGELPVIHADPMQMQQLLQNLLANAMKFHKPDTPPQVKVYSHTNSNGFVELIVEDNGIGFDMALADRLFKPFHRLVGKGEYEGTGMGLAICSKIAERHGGSIEVRSEPGSGTAFTVKLPVTPNFL